MHDGTASPIDLTGLEQRGSDRVGAPRSLLAALLQAPTATPKGRTGHSLGYFWKYLSVGESSPRSAEDKLEQGFVYQRMIECPPLTKAKDQEDARIYSGSSSFDGAGREPRPRGVRFDR